MDHSALTAVRYVALLRDIAEPLGVTADALMAGTGMDPRSLDDPLGFIGMEALARLLNNFISLTGDPLPGVLVGRRLNFSGHGSIGMAGLTAANGIEALAVAQRFFELVTGMVKVQLQEQGKSLVITFVPLPDVPDVVEQFGIHTLLASVELMATFLFGRLNFQVDLAWPQQDALVTRLGENIDRLRFNQPRHRFLVPLALLRIPFALADRAAHERAVRQCEKELMLLHAHRTFADRIYRELLMCSAALPTIEDIAAAMHVTSRTVYRRLKAEGTCFRDLVNTARISKAKRYLLRSGLSITATAHQLGYRDSANFTRAFRRELGMTPSEFLRHEKGGGR